MNIAQLDHRITARIHRPHSIWRLFSRLGDGWVYAASFLWLRETGSTIAANRVASAILCAWGLCAMLKAICRRERPAKLPIITSHLPPSFWMRYRIAARLRSFPSQHAAVAVAFAFALWPEPWPIALAGLICASRVLIGSHYVGDVLAGIAVGLIAGRLA